MNISALLAGFPLVLWCKTHYLLKSFIGQDCTQFPQKRYLVVYFFALCEPCFTHCLLIKILQESLCNLPHRLVLSYLGDNQSMNSWHQLKPLGLRIAPFPNCRRPATDLDLSSLPQRIKSWLCVADGGKENLTPLTASL